jgi:hypothetical protein
MNNLDTLSELYAQRDLLQLDLNAKRAQVMAIVQDQLDALELEYTPKLVTVTEKIEQTETTVKEEALTAGETQRGQFLMAKWAKGRNGGYDTAGLDRYSNTHPEILVFKKKDGEPIVTICKL